MTNAELCARIAALDPEWFKNLPGVAVKDPETGHVFRFCRTLWAHETTRTFWQAGAGCDALGLMRALDAGPDWTDLVTVNALLGDNGMVRVTDERGGWRAWIADWDGPVVPDRVQAILLAKFASLGG